MRFLSYNILRPIWALPGWPTWESRREGLARVIRDARPDYVALQEEDAAMVADLLTLLPEYRYLSTAPEPGSGSGLLVHAEAVRPGQTERIELPGRRVANFWPLSGADDRTRWVGSTHFYPFPEPEFVRMRTESARRILEWRQGSAPHDAVLLMGDYNSLPDDPAVDLFLAAGFRDAIPHGVDGRPARVPTATEFRPEGGWRLDYLFHSPQWQVRHAAILHPHPAPSDHHPLFVEMEP